MSSSNKRQSILPRVQSGPKAPVNFSSSITIADSALLTGNHTINIAAESVIHPRAKLDSSNGRINIGRRCIIQERTTIGLAFGDATPSDSRGGVEIGDYVTVELSSTIESGGTVIEEGCLVGIYCRVGRGARLGRNCILTPHSVVHPGEVVPDFTVVYSNGFRRQDKRGITDLRNKSQARQIETIRKLIPSNPAKFQ